MDVSRSAPPTGGAKLLENMRGKSLKECFKKKAGFSFLIELLYKVKSTACSRCRMENHMSCLRPFASLKNEDRLYPSPQKPRALYVSGSRSSLQFKFLLRLKPLWLSTRAKPSLCAPYSLLQLPGEHLFHVYIRCKLVCLYG